MGSLTILHALAYVYILAYTDQGCLSHLGLQNGNVLISDGTRNQEENPFSSSS